jgi:site-specific recombinase XerD
LKFLNSTRYSFLGFISDGQTLRPACGYIRTVKVNKGTVFLSQNGMPLTRFGIYKIVRRHTDGLWQRRKGTNPHHLSPHIFRHTAAVHLLESGVDVNVIRYWLGHVSLETTNHYAEITTRMKEEALRACEPTDVFSP